MIHIDTNACNDSGAFQLSENAGAFFRLDKHVIRPAQVTGEIGHFEDRFAGGEAQSQRDEGQGAGRETMPQNDGDIETGAGLGVPDATVASLPGGLLVRANDGPGFASSGRKTAGDRKSVV